MIRRSEATELIAGALYALDKDEMGLHVCAWADALAFIRERYRRRAACALDALTKAIQENRAAAPARAASSIGNAAPQNGAPA